MSLGSFLTVDPGEDTGWSVWSGTELIESGTEKMWVFGDAVWEYGIAYRLGENADSADHEVTQLLSLHRVEHIVLENWSLYPWKLRKGELDWDECRTARLIGSLFQVCRVTGWTYEQQPAKIKERAVAAGAEAYFSHPLHENRHANDAIMHGVYRNAIDQGAPWVDLSKTSWTTRPE